MKGTVFDKLLLRYESNNNCIMLRSQSCVTNIIMIICGKKMPYGVEKDLGLRLGFGKGISETGSSLQEGQTPSTNRRR